MEHAGKVRQKLRLNKECPGKQWETYCMKSKYLAEINMKKPNDAPTSRGSHSFQSQIGFRCCKRLEIPRYVVKASKREMSFRRRRNWRCSLVNLVLSGVPHLGSHGLLCKICLTFSQNEKCQLQVGCQFSSLSPECWLISIWSVGGCTSYSKVPQKPLCAGLRAIHSAVKNSGLNFRWFWDILDAPFQEPSIAGPYHLAQ